MKRKENIIRQKEFFIKLEKICLFAVLLSIMIPLAPNFGLVQIAFVNVPMVFLFALWLVRLIKTREIPLLSLNLWDCLALALAAWMCFSTLLVAPDNIGFALCWASMFFLALYSRININKTFDRSFIVTFAVVALTIEISVSLLQFFTHSYIGSVSRYFGTVTRDIIDNEPFFRVEGTLPQVNSLGIWITMLSPFIYDKMLQSYREKKYISGHFLLLLFLLCLAVLIIAISRWNLIIMLLIPFFFYLSGHYAAK